MMWIGKDWIVEGDSLLKQITIFLFPSDIFAAPLRPVSMKDVEWTLNKSRTADSSAARKGSVLPAAGNVPAFDIAYTSFTAREQRRAAIMSDIARLAQHPLQRSMPGIVSSLPPLHSQRILPHTHIASPRPHLIHSCRQGWQP